MKLAFMHVMIHRLLNEHYAVAIGIREVTNEETIFVFPSCVYVLLIKI